MPWKEATRMTERLEFITFATLPGANIRQLCRRFGISRKTGHKWLKRYRHEGLDALADRSQRPQSSPMKTPPEMEEKILRFHEKHQTWAGRKIFGGLVKNGSLPEELPSPTTINAILKRRGPLSPPDGDTPAGQPCQGKWQRFEAQEPNELWQMDFKGHFPLLGTAVAAGASCCSARKTSNSSTCRCRIGPEEEEEERCHPFGILDDHARFSLGLYACPGEDLAVVRPRLIRTFERYGMPACILTDNGPPWGTRGQESYSGLEVWLIRLGVGVIHSRVCHPQTCGKIERFNRTLKAEVLQGRHFSTLRQCQQAFDRWRQIYNFERPHDALGQQVPADRYRPSPRTYPSVLPPIEYGPDDLVRKVQSKGDISFSNRTFIIGKAFYHLPVAVRPTCTDGLYEVYFCRQHIMDIDLKQP